MFWRPTSAYGDLLPEVAAILRDLPDGLVQLRGGLARRSLSPALP